MFKSWRFWLGIAISIVCLYLSFQGIRLDQVASALSGMSFVWLVPAVVLFMTSYVGRVFRWQLLFSPQKVHLSAVFHALNVGYFLSNILPARLGDIIRAYLLGDTQGVSKARALSTVVVERLTDGLTVVLLLAITAVFVPNILDEARKGAIGVAFVGIVGLAVLMALSFQKERGLSLLKRIAAPFPFLRNDKIWGTLESLIDGFAVLRSPRPIFGVWMWSLEAWILGGLMYWTVMFAMGMSLPIAAAFLVMTVTSLAVVVPSTPGYIGVFEAATTATLTAVYQIDQANALSYALVMHAFTYFWLIVLGVFSVWREGLTYQRLQLIQTDTPTPKNGR